jgi:hypothetical protein
VKKIESTPIRKKLPVFSTYDKQKYDENLHYLDLSQIKKNSTKNSRQQTTEKIRHSPQIDLLPNIQK